MKLLLLPLVVVLSGMTSGCSNWWHKPVQGQPPSPNAKYEQQDLGSLVLFSGDIVRMPESDRAAECQHVKNLVQGNPLLAFRLRLAAIQGITESCGSLQEARESLRATKAEIKDASVLAWVIYLEEMIVAVESERNNRKTAEGNVKKVRATAKRSLREAKSKESELKALQNKLDALKSIEQSLGGSQGEH